MSLFYHSTDPNAFSICEHGSQARRKSHFSGIFIGLGRSCDQINANEKPPQNLTEVSLTGQSLLHLWLECPMAHQCESSEKNLLFGNKANGQKPKRTIT